MQEFEETADLLLGQYVHSALERLYNQFNNYNKPDLDGLLAYYQALRDVRIADEIKPSVIIKGNTSQLSDYIQRGHRYLQRYWGQHFPFPDIKIIQTEMRIVFEIMPDVVFRGVIDRLDKDGDALVINDYKTNKQLPPAEDHHYQDQLTLYAAGIQEKYGKYATKTIARLHYLHFDIVEEREVTNDRLESVLTSYRTLINEIENQRFHYNM